VDRDIPHIPQPEWGEVVTPAEVERLARGERCLSRSGQLFSLELNAEERAELERAKRRGCVVCRGSRDRLSSVWWYWCQAKGEPYIAIKVRRTQAAVILELTAPGIELSPEAVAEARSAIWSHARKGGFSYGTRAASHPSVPIDRAELLARDLLDIAWEGARPTEAPCGRPLSH
jgi:hypothetical protein